MEGARLDAVRAELLKPGTHLAGGLVGERDGEDLGRLERAGQDLVRDPARDRRRLARAGAREDAHRTAHGLDRCALLRVEAGEDVFRSHPVAA